MNPVALCYYVITLWTASHSIIIIIIINMNNELLNVTAVLQYRCVVSSLMHCLLFTNVYAKIR